MLVAVPVLQGHTDDACGTRFHLVTDEGGYVVDLVRTLPDGSTWSLRTQGYHEGFTAGETGQPREPRSFTAEETRSFVGGL